MKDNQYLYREFLRKKIYCFRINHLYTQEKMAEMLQVTPRSYLAQEHGEYGFSAFTLLFYLCMLSEGEVLGLLKEFREMWEKQGAERPDI